MKNQTKKNYNKRWVECTLVQRFCLFSPYMCVCECV